jgi:RimJ/RimL family protein N-acetyltransferase
MDRTWIVQGQRVGLTAMEREEFVARWDRYNDPELTMLMGYATSPISTAAPTHPPVTREQREALWEQIVSRHIRGFDIRAVEDQRFIGECSLSRITWPSGSGEIAVAIFDADDRGRGHGTEAVMLLTAYGFDAFGLNRVALRYLAVNDAVVAACERSAEAVGGRVVGIEREAGWAFGAHQDCVTLEILAADFPPHPATAHLREAPTRVELPS